MGEARGLIHNDSVTSVGNGLSSEVLRARTAEYYNQYMPHTPRNLQKSNSVTRLNGFADHSHGKMAPNGYLSTKEAKGHSRETEHRYSSNPRGGSVPQRTHSERSNRFFQPITGSPNKLGLYRSNSSLDLDHDDSVELDRGSLLKREYGSASSLDIIGTTGDSFFAMLREYRHDSVDQRSPGPARIQEYLRGRVDPPPATQNASNALSNGSDCLDDASSPKLKTKFHKLWEAREKTSGHKGSSVSSARTSKMILGSSEPSLFKKLRGAHHAKSVEIIVDPTRMGSDNSLDAESRLEEKLRKRAFAHYDFQSLTANLSYASRLCYLLRKRRNTTTGASAASMLSRTPSGSTESVGSAEDAIADSGDGQSNDLVLSCPFFRNELGGEEERMICLSKLTCKRQRKAGSTGQHPPALHRPSIACGLSILELESSTRWKHRACPYQRHSLMVENVDAGALYYRTYFYNSEHQNWFGVDESLGPLAISIKKERTDERVPPPSGSTSTNQTLYRVIIRTSELAVMRGSVLEEAIPGLSSSSSSRGSRSGGHLHAKEVLEYIAPELQLPFLRLGLQNTQTEEQLLKLDEQGLTNTYKVGIMYCKANQSTEEEMYNNEHSGPAFEEFLDMLGKRVRLKGFEKYRAGLDNKADTTGLYSVYATHQDYEIMFHVSTMLPYTPNNRQQLLRKRHIGNDIVTIVFQEPDAQPFTPKSIRSHFQHVFIVVRAINPCTDRTRYSVTVSRSKEVPIFGPAIPEGGTFQKSKSFADFLLAKVINAENAAHHSEKFATMAQRTRQEYLKDLATNHVSTTTLDSGQKFSLLSSFGGRKKERPRARFIPDSCVSGAICWQVQVEDYGQSSRLDCLLGISADTLVLVQERSKEVVFVSPCSSVIGWTSHTSTLKIFYHQGECVVIHTKDPDVDEIQEIVSRLSFVTRGCETQELILRRNSLGQLGFHVQYEGVVTEVEGFGFAWQAGLRQGSRLVEICKVASSTLSYDQMVDLLKTSMTVTVTVIPPFPDGNPRKGCPLSNCNYLSSSNIPSGSHFSSSASGDYENVGQHPSEAALSRSQQHHTNHTRNGSRTPRQQQHQQGMVRHESRKSSSVTPNGLQLKSSVHSIVNGGLHHSSASRNAVGGSSKSMTPSGGSRSTPSTPFPSNPHPLPPTSHHHHHHYQSSAQRPLTHIGGLVASRSELSLNELVTNSRSLEAVRSHHPHLPSATPSIASRIDNPPDYNYVTSQVKHRGVGGGKSPSSLWSSPSPSVILSSVLDSQPKSLPTIVNYSDYYSDSSSDWHQGASSADELSGGSQRGTPPGRIGYQKLNHQSETAAQVNNASHTQIHRPRPEGSSSCSVSSYPVVRGLGAGRHLHQPTGGNSNQQHPQGPRPNSSAQRLLSPPNNNISVKGHSCSSGGSSSSGSGSSSTLQEDLLKLISPDFLDSDNSQELTGISPASRVGSSSECGGSSPLSLCSTQPSTPYSSLERPNPPAVSMNHHHPVIKRPVVGPPPPPPPPAPSLAANVGNGNPVGPSNGTHDVILTKAQPAHVISSEPNSPVEINNLSREERLSPRVMPDHLPIQAKGTRGSSLKAQQQRGGTTGHQNGGSLGHELEWTVLVEAPGNKPKDIQSRPLLQVKGASTVVPSAGVNADAALWGSTTDDIVVIQQDKSSGVSTMQQQMPVEDLQAKVWKLENDLANEQNHTANLEQEMQRLRLENQRLQEANAAKFHKIAQLFLNNVDP